MKSVSYRKRAEVCLAMMELVNSQEAKSFLFSMAQSWHRLAQDAEELEHVAVPEDGSEKARA